MSNLKIDVKFTRAGKKELLCAEKFTYRSASPATDSLQIFNKSVVIETSRSSNSSDLLQAHNSTIFKQIVKALCLYYIVERRPNQLSEITITQTKSRATPISTSIHKAKLRQVVARTADLSVLHKVKQREASLLLSESPSGRAVLHAATHLIKSLDSSSPFDRFEKLWRAFNALYKAFAKASTDHACHVVLRKHIEDFPKSFPLSIAEVGPLSADDIRGQILWNQMILNNHPTQAKTQALKEAILRNSDHRILQIYNDSLPVRKTFLVRGGFYEEIVNHIQNGITAKFVRDSDVISILCIKYMYFVRNKIAHAERADHGFSFLHGSTDESEIRWLAPFLEALVIDLINISYTF